MSDLVTVSFVGDSNKDGFLNAKEYNALLAQEGDLGKFVGVTVRFNTDMTGKSIAWYPNYNTLDASGKPDTSGLIRSDYPMGAEEMENGFVFSVPNTMVPNSVFTTGFKIINPSGSLVAGTPSLITAQITIDTIAPPAPTSIEILTDTNGDGVFNLSEIVASLGTLTAKVGLPAGAQVGDKLVFTASTGKDIVSSGVKPLVLTQAMIDAGAVTVAGILPAAPGKSLSLSASLEDLAGNQSAGSVADTLSTPGLLLVAPTITIASDVNGDGTVNTPELNGLTTLTVTATLPNGTAVGDKLTINGGSPIVVTVADLIKGAITAAIPLPAQGTANITAVVSNEAGSSPVATTHVDMQLSTFKIMGMSKDDGASGSDWITDNYNAGRGIYGTLEKTVEANQKVIVSVDGGYHWKEASVSGYTWAVTDLNWHFNDWTIVTRLVEVLGTKPIINGCGDLDTSAVKMLQSTAQKVTMDYNQTGAPYIDANSVNVAAGTVVVDLKYTGASVGDTLHVKWGNDTVDYKVQAADLVNKVTLKMPADVLADTSNDVAHVGVSVNLIDIAGNVSCSSWVINGVCCGPRSDLVLTMHDDSVVAEGCDRVFTLKDEAYFTQATAGIDGGRDCGIDILKMNGADLDLTALTHFSNNLFSKPALSSIEIIDMSNGENLYHHNKTGLAISGNFETLGKGDNLVYVSKNHCDNTAISNTVNHTDVSADANIYRAEANGLNDFNYGGQTTGTNLQIHGQNTVINLDRVASKVSFEINELHANQYSDEYVRFFDGNGCFIDQFKINQANDSGVHTIDFTAPAGRVIGKFDFVTCGYEHFTVDNITYTPAFTASADTLTLSVNDVLQTGAMNQFFCDNHVQLLVKGDSNVNGQGDTVNLEKINTEFGVSDTGHWTLSSQTVNVCKTDACGYDTFNVYTHSTMQADLLVQQGLTVNLMM